MRNALAVHVRQEQHEAAEQVRRLALREGRLWVDAGIQQDRAVTCSRGKAMPAIRHAGAQVSGVQQARNPNWLDTLKLQSYRATMSATIRSRACWSSRITPITKQHHPARA